MERPLKSAALAAAVLCLAAACAFAAGFVTQNVTATFQPVALAATADGAVSVDFRVPQAGQTMIADPVTMTLAWTSLVISGEHRSITVQLDSAPPAWLVVSLSNSSNGNSAGTFTTVTALTDSPQTLVSGIPSEIVNGAVFQCASSLAAGYTIAPPGVFSYNAIFTLTD